MALTTIGDTVVSLLGLQVADADVAAACLFWSVQTGPSSGGTTTGSAAAHPFNR